MLNMTEVLSNQVADLHISVSALDERVKDIETDLSRLQMADNALALIMYQEFHRNLVELLKRYKMPHKTTSEILASVAVALADQVSDYNFMNTEQE